MTLKELAIKLDGNIVRFHRKECIVVLDRVKDLPEGFIKFDLRHGNEWLLPVTIEKFVWVNHCGSVIFQVDNLPKKLKFLLEADSGYYPLSKSVSRRFIDKQSYSPDANELKQITEDWEDFQETNKDLLEFAKEYEEKSGIHKMLGID